MEKVLGFKIANLFEITPLEDIFSGPYSLVQLASSVGRQIEMPLNRLCRVEFNDPAVLSYLDDDGFLQADCLLMGTQAGDELFILLWADVGAEGFAIASAATNDPDPVWTEIYQEAVFERKFTREELKILFDIIFRNSHLIAPPHIEGDLRGEEKHDGKDWIPIQRQTFLEWNSPLIFPHTKA